MLRASFDCRRRALASCSSRRPTATERRRVLARGGRTQPLAFPLARLPRAAELTFVHASDTHISQASLARTQRLRALVDSLRPDLLLITGDLVRDALRVPEAEARGYYDLFMRETRRVHERPCSRCRATMRIFGIERDTSHVSVTHPLYGRKMYHHYLGPDYYSFTRGGVHFVGLNTVDIDDQRYYGHVDSLQLAWLERDLALVPATMPVVTFDHIPFFTTFEAMSGYNDRSAGAVADHREWQDGVPTHRFQRRGGARCSAQASSRARARRPHARHRAHRVRDGRREDALQSDLRHVGGPREAGLQFISGVTFYRVKNGVIDVGRFIPLDPVR